jgi:two-component system, sensor histidine kinase and response regulator
MGESEAEVPPALSAVPAERKHEKLALGIALFSVALFACLAPFAKAPLERFPAFIPLYQSALIVNDLVTAALLYAQWRAVRTLPLFVLACGYLFTALMIVAHTLSFPGLLAPQGVIGGGAQTTAWLYMFWHALFPVFVVLYASARPATLDKGHALAGVGATVALAVALAALAGPGEALLPAIMGGNRYLPAYHVVVGLTWLCSVAALVLTWRKRPRTVLDIWVMVVLAVWICEIALAAVLNAGRFDLGFYAGRIYGFAASAFLLAVLIFESSALHARSAQADAERARNAEAQAASRAKDQFLAVLGHELRNPLAPIVTALQIMRMRDPNALAAERLIIERQVQHLRRLVDDLLDISRLTRGMIELRRTRCEAADLVARALEVDGDRVAQALCNLISNAAKYTPPGGHIRVSAAREGTDVVFRVRDDGEGLAPELLERLFEPFTQAPQSYDRAQGGLGLGLAIVRSLARLHGGSVSAASDGPGRGAEFLLRLPATGAPVRPPEPARPAISAGRRGAAASVLIVDDNVDAAAMLAHALRMHGLQVQVAHDAREALLAAKAQRPDAVLLDLGLPGTDGFQLARELRALPGIEKVRIAALTGYGQESDRARSASAGFTAHFVKPASTETLVEFLRA